jgi:hypothetical protein
MTMEVIMTYKNFWPLSFMLILILAACTSSPSVEETIPTPALDAVEPVQKIIVETAEMVPTAVPTQHPEIDEEFTVDTAVLPTSSSVTLTEPEIEALQFMREEEKLARDVYLVLYEQWGLLIFQNIAGSEQTHINTVLGLMQRYELVDDAANLNPGEFANADLQALYEQLITSGSQSLADALRIGALIEETDIVDLENRLSALENGEIIQAFNNLRQGSLNHLRSYANMLERQTGEVYQPQILTTAAYADILTQSPNGMGGQNQEQGNGRGNGNGNGGGNG